MIWEMQLADAPIEWFECGDSEVGEHAMLEWLGDVLLECLIEKRKPGHTRVRFFYGKEPVNKEAPVITGAAIVGRRLHCSTGIWAGAPAITYSFQWKRSLSGGGSETNIGDNSADYDLVAADAGFFISCEVTATNFIGTTSATSNLVGPTTVGLGSVATRTYLPGDSWLSGTYTKFNSRSWHKATEDITSLRLLFANWIGRNEIVAGVGTVTLTASIEYPAGTFTQVLFGAATATSVLDGENALSDPVTISIPAGTTFWIRNYVQSPIGAYKMGTSLADPARGDCYEATTTAADKTMGGTIPAAVDFIYMPAAILAPSVKPCTALVGDSRVYGVQVDPPDGDRGELAPRLGANGQSYLNMGCPAETAQGYVANHARRVALITAYCSKVILQYGINDVLFERTDTQLRADLNTIRSYFPDLPVELSTMPPVTTSTDGWTTSAGQTPHTPIGAPQRILNNNWRRSVPDGFSACIEVADAVETARNSGIWKSPGYTTDGAHHTLLSENAIEIYIPPT
jgi:hypothetical protein